MQSDLPMVYRAPASGEPPAPIEPPPLGEQVYRALREQVIGGRLRPGEKLSDLRLSAELQVSRTPVREALYRLAQEGVVQVHRRRGFAVTRMTRRDVRELYEIRLGLEILAVRLGGPQLGEAALLRAQAAHEAMAAILPTWPTDAPEIFHLADVELHHTLFVAAQNRRLLTLREGLQAQLDVLQVYGLHMEPLMLLSIEHHMAILGALAAHDWSAAEGAMARHVTAMEVAALAIFERHDP